MNVAGTLKGFTITGGKAYVKHTEGSKDIDGNPRVHGGAIDMGAYELQTGPVKKPAETKEN